jgi:chromosome segregation ATPase
MPGLGRKKVQDLGDVNLNDMKWALEISRLQTAEKNLNAKLDENLFERNRNTELISQLRANNRRLHERNAGLENSYKTVDENLKKVLRDRTELREDIKARETLYKEQIGLLRKQSQTTTQNLEEQVTGLTKERDKLQKDIRRFDLEHRSQTSVLNQKLVTLRNERDGYWRQNQTFVRDHKRELDILEQTNREKERRCETLTAEERKLRLDIQSLTTEQRRLNNALGDHQHRSKNEITRLESQIERQACKIEELTESNSNANNEIESLNDALQKSQNETSFHRDDAAKLRAYMAKAESQQSPLRDEDFYIQNFAELKTEVENWIARNSRINSGHALSASDSEFILQSLDKLGPFGHKATEYLRVNDRVQRWYSTPRWRIPFVRHIVAAFLHAHILQKFVVGLPTASSEILEWIDRDLVSGGLPIVTCADFRERSQQDSECSTIPGKGSCQIR